LGEKRGSRTNMGYYEEKKAELDYLLSLTRSERAHFEFAAQQERAALGEEASKIEKAREDMTATYEKLRGGVIQMAKERQIGFPWLAKAYDELLEREEYQLVSFLENKPRPALTAAAILMEHARLRRKAERERKIAQYLVEYYESIAPFLVDLREEVDAGAEQEALEILRAYSEEELQDETTSFLTKEEYRRLSSVERNQLALDRFWRRPKSRWVIGCLYERYIGYLYEESGYRVEYVGITKGYEDLGRDLICHKGGDSIVVQCKNWSQFHTIYEKHVFQFFGTCFEYRYVHPEENVTPAFYTTTELSDLARGFAFEMGIELYENFKFDTTYPSIKCNISRASGEKIYHLLFDQQYDNTRIEPSRGEFYCATVEEAEEAGFRRALRHVHR
jgi:DUF2075 family protein